MKPGSPKFTQRLTTIGIVILFTFGLAVPTLVLAFNGENKASVAPGGVHLDAEEQRGREMFASSCVFCHTLKAVNGVGRTGPDLDILFKEIKSPSVRQKIVEGAIKEGQAFGRGQMPALLYRGHEATEVAEFVAAVAGHGNIESLDTEATPKTSEKAPAKAAPAARKGAEISTATISSVGEVLVNSEGRTLYIFVPDDHSKVTCVSACADVWPPAKLASGEKATAAGAVKSSLLGSDPNPSGGEVVTYNGWPLYTYVADSSSGTANGQGVDANGGLWYVISPSGEVIKKAP